MNNTPNPKRPCYDASSSTQNPNSLPIASDLNQRDFDSTISSFLLLPDSPYIGRSFDRVLGQILSSASGDEDRIIDRTRNLASILYEAAKRFARNRAALYNYDSWSLPHGLTIKVFSMLDTKSLMRAAACCTMFSKSAMDPLCYSHMDFTTTTKRINEDFVCTMIPRASKELRSLKLGRITRQVIPSLTSSSCLAGDLLRSLYFYCLDCTCTKSLCDVLSACPNLTDLKIVNFDKRHLLEKVLKSLTGNHRSMEHLHLENRMDTAATGLSSSAAEAFVASCPNLTSLTLIGFKLKDETTRNLALGFPKLNYMNLSKTPAITGRFLSDLVNSGRGNSPLKTLILRNCPSLNNVEITQFLKSLITTGCFRFMHIDVSSDHGFRDHRGNIILVPIPKNLLTTLREARSDVTFVAKSNRLLLSSENPSLFRKSRS